MPYTDNNNTAWGEIALKIGDANPTGAMQTTLESIGIVKEDSISIDTQDGKKMEWKAVGGAVIDSLQGEPTLTIKAHVKNLNKTALSKFWTVKEATDNLEVSGFTNTKKFAISLEPSVVGAEVTNYPLTTINAKPVFKEDAGWGLDIEIKILKPAGDKPIMIISRKK